MGFGTIFFIVVTVIVLYQLWTVLGRRTGNERPPYDPYTRNEQNGAANPGNVVTLPSRRMPDAEPVASSYEAIDKLAEPGTTTNTELRRIKDADPSFDAPTFVDGAKVAYEMIVTAFADGDRKLLRNLLSPEVYQGFDTAITDREKRGERMQSSFVGIDDARVVSAELKGTEAYVTLRIVSQLISAVLKPDGTVADGDPETVVEVRDVWTFARDTRSRDPNWKLVETESEES
ncbi:Tim44/TimA family putative adaptor protein [Aureimonas altamirensis]|jgi:predicted lipid-binding transport protein (Tim44 family)|uniref:Import inner membrane translocase subunit Tim44 n=2 Tax=Aureimonas altamirensis TaxID=370622 RepID=A0A0P0YVD5_9HYPH|nr:Tim44/TimA family putative adaptor protein [Aureimonas altamirensis]BAT25373.1 import inner membrane translocase subunit Tim44 [Aureimonas altamirensis]SHJ98973.1 Predicted lipid-binding transport protein, Tim44 family [Aureimonas altamirensis DSM 21988]